MSSTITFFPVGNGDMTLIALGDTAQTKILIDCNIRGSADDPDDPTRDVAADLRRRLRRDPRGRPYVDVFLLSHPDQDHCNGFAKHFYTGALADYPDDWKPDAQKRIVIREIWSSPMVFRRASKSHVLCDDAKAFNTEAKRRVAVNRWQGFMGVGAGDRILVLGEDEDGKTDDLVPILVRVDQLFSQVCGAPNLCFQARLLAPMPKADDQTEDELRKNHSSVILNMTIASDPSRRSMCQFLTAGDAEVAIWERLWNKHLRQPAVLAYDLLQTPHHCSWHSLSYDSWSELHERAEISRAARGALSQIRKGGIIVSSSEAIYNDDNDPPCYGAMREYQRIAAAATGSFFCTGEYPSANEPLPLEFTVTQAGIELSGVATRSRPGGSAVRPAAAVGGLGFPNRPITPNKPAGFA
jgi:hypothetical protein